MDVDVPPEDRVTDFGFGEALGLWGLDGEIVTVRLTTPANPLTLASVMVLFPDCPLLSVRESLVEVMVKSGAGVPVKDAVWAIS